MVKRPRTRPRFALEVSLRPDDVIALVKQHLDSGDGRITGTLFRRTIMLTVREADQHFWSPYLDVQLDETPQGSKLNALFAPQPQIWMSFLAVQAIFALLSIGALVYLTSLLMRGEPLLWGLIALIAFLVGGGLAYGGAYIGQGVGSEQMYQLRAWLDNTLREVTQKSPG